MNNKVIKICFFGPSESGKSTIADILRKDFWDKNYWAYVVGVATPLHDMQNSIYKILELENRKQDGVLLQFSNGSFKFYKTVDGLAKAALYKLKRG